MPVSFVPGVYGVHVDMRHEAPSTHSDVDMRLEVYNICSNHHICSHITPQDDMLALTKLQLAPGKHAAEDFLGVESEDNFWNPSIVSHHITQHV